MTGAECRHGMPGDPDLALSPAALQTVPADIREAVESCPDCNWLVLRAAKDDASQSRAQRAWWYLTNTSGRPEREL